MPIITRRLMQIAVVVSFAIALALPAQAVTYSKASLNGTYNFLFNVRSADTNVIQVVTVGVLNFNGKGAVRGSYTSLEFQQFQSGTLVGNYTVAANGIGTITFNEGLPSKFETVLSSNAGGVVNGIRMLQTNLNSNEIVIGGAQLLSTTAQTYSVASLNGVFSIQYKVFAADVNIIQAASIGLASFDGAGNCKLTLETVSDGRFSTSTQSYTYTVASNGMGTISNGAVFALGGAPAGQATGLQLVVATPQGEPPNFVVFGDGNLQ